MMGRHKEEMQKFTRLAAAIGESVEDVCNMPDEERTQLMKVMHMEDEEGAGGGTKPENEGNHSKDEVEEDTPSKRSRRGKRKPVFDALFDWNNDDDFVDDTKKPKDTSGAAGSKDSGWLSVTDQPSTSSGLTASGRPSRHAAVKANARVECINRLYTRPQSHSRLDVGSTDDIEEFQSQEVQPRRKSMEHTSPIKRESTRLRSQIKGNSYEPNATANESKRDEDDKIAQLIDSLNGKLKMSPLIPHTQSPKDFMRDLDDLPLMDCNKLQQRIGIESKDDAATDSILSKHLKIVRNISSKGLVHSTRSPLSWQKVLSSRKKHLEVNLKRNQAAEVDLTNFETNAELTGKQKQEVETLSIARFIKKPSLSNAGSSISKLSLDGNAPDTLKEEGNIFNSKRRRTSLLNLSTDSSHLLFRETKSFQSNSPDVEGKVLGNIRNILDSSNVTGSSVITIPSGSSITSQNSDLDVTEDKEIGKETFKFFKSKNPHL